jgi:DNA-binding LytR/AlgR family response regulator
MTRLRALVLEDEWLARNYLVQLIEVTKLAEVVGAVATVSEARDVLAALPVDVVFVDVQLSGDESGLDLVQSMASSDGARPAFVLATAFSQHALEAWNLGVVDYLLKPFSEERVEQCLRRLAVRPQTPHSSAIRVVARRKRSLVFLEPTDIWAFEASPESWNARTARRRCSSETRSATKVRACVFPSRGIAHSHCALPCSQTQPACGRRPRCPEAGRVAPVR